MSIEIVYDRRFIRTTRGIIPLVLAGSSNCFDVKVDRCGRTYEVAERHWTYFFKRETLEMNEGELLAYIRETCDSNPDMEGFRYRGKMLLYGEVEKWYAAGIRSAYSIEAYLDTNPRQTLRCYLAVYKIVGGKEIREDIQTEYIRTTEQLEAWMDRYLVFRRENEGAEGFDVYPCIKFSNNEPLHMPTRIEGPVVARYHRNGSAYVSSYTKDKGLVFSPDIREAVIFSSVDEAYKMMGKGWSNLHFVKAETPSRVKPFVIRLEGGKRSGEYVIKKGPFKLFTSANCMQAMRFRTPGEALRYARSLREKGFYEERIGKFLLWNLMDNTHSLMEV